MSTQQGFGLLLNELGRSSEKIADRIVTTSPDVTVSTNLGAFVNRRGLFARQDMKDLFKAERIPSTFTWDFSPKGQHLELGIAEMNLFILLSALGLSHSLFGERLIPIGTLYDPFIARGLDALNYACYQDARFILVATPSGVTLAPEGGAHQSIGTPLIGLAQDGLAAFEPAFVDELAVILRFAFDYLQRSGETEPSERSWLRDETGGSVYLRLSTRVLEQPQREIDRALRDDIIDGAYWLRRPGAECPSRRRLHGSRRTRSRRSGGADRRGPARRGPSRRDLGRQAQCRLDRGSTRQRAWPRACHKPYRASAGRGASPLRPHHRARRTSRDARLARLGHGSQDALSRRRAFRADGHDFRSLSPLRHRRSGDPRGGADDRARPSHQAFESRRSLTHEGFRGRRLDRFTASNAAAGVGSTADRAEPGGLMRVRAHHGPSKERAVTTRFLTLAAGLALLSLPLAAQAQGIVRGAQEGAAIGGNAGARTAGPVGTVVGATVGGVAGGVAGGVNGALGVQPASYHGHHYRHHHYHH